MARRSLTVSTPNGTGSLPFMNGSYSISSTGNTSQLPSGTYIFSGSGGPDAGAFTVQVTIPGGGGGGGGGGANGGFNGSTSDGKSTGMRNPG